VVAGNEAGHDERLRLRARLREPALDEDDVQALLQRAIPHVPSKTSPGSRRIRLSPELNAFGGHVIGSTAKPRRPMSGRSPLKRCTHGHDASAQTVTPPISYEPSQRSVSSSRASPKSSSTSHAI